MSYLFTSESVSSGHPDKIADQISDAILDEILEADPDARVACETFVTTNRVIVGGEIKTAVYPNIDAIVRDTIRKIGYTNPDYLFCADSVYVENLLHMQSADINQGVDREDGQIGAGDQGIMFGYATNECEAKIPITLDLSHKILQTIEDFRKSRSYPWLRPDAKAQVTLKYDDNGFPEKIDTILVSTQHDDYVNQEEIQNFVKHAVITKLLQYNPEYTVLFNTAEIKYLVNPTGRFVIGGPHGDAGLTGRKIIVDTYGGRGAHGGGAFSGKDATKVDRSGAYAARYIAKHLVAGGLYVDCLVQLSYAIGVVEPTSINITGLKLMPKSDDEIIDFIKRTFPLTPSDIIQYLGLNNPIYKSTSTYGHFGRKVSFDSYGRKLFPWEDLDRLPLVHNFMYS